MDKGTRIEKLAQNDEDKLLLAKLYDKITAGMRKNILAASFFLSPREIVLVQSLFRQENVILFGGAAEAERKICCWIPDYFDESILFDDEESPLCAVRAEFYAADALTHRDFLGSLMGCGIKRETVGDIYVGEGCCDFILTREILPYVLQNLQSAGRTKLRLRQIPLGEVALPQPKLREISATVSSLRLDSIVSAGFGIARGKAAEFVENGRVFLNDMPVLKPDKPIAEGDKIALRGMGKIFLCNVGGRTKKDRICITINRYE